MRSTDFHRKENSMAFKSQDLMVSIMPLQMGDATCPEHTISGCVNMVTAAFASAEPEGLALLQRQLRTVLAQAAA
jgi:hypothetical protein